MSAVLDTDYWILDLTQETIEVFRRPRNGGYRERRILSADQDVSPEACLSQLIPVRELLP